MHGSPALSCCLISATLLAASSEAHASIVYVSQARSVSARANTIGGTDVTQTFAAPDFGVFDRAASATSSGVNTGSGTAQQTSSLTSSGISATGYWLGSGHVLPPSASGGGTSSFSVDFVLDEAAPYTLTTNSFVYGLPETSFSFRAIDGRPFNLSTAPASLSGFLPAGSYRLAALVTGDRSFPGSGWNFSVQLSVPAPQAMAVILPAAMLPVSRRRAPAHRTR